MYVDIGLGGSPLLPNITGTDTTDTDAASNDNQIDTNEDETSSKTTMIARSISNTVVQVWNTGTIQTITRWTLRLLVVYVVVGMACAAALLVHGSPRSVQLLINTISFSWWTAQLVMFVGCAATGIGARCSRRPRLLSVHPSTPWLSVDSARGVWASTAWMV